jgi:Flp pilus assembly protein TadD
MMAMVIAPEAVSPMLLGVMAFDALGEREKASRLLRSARTRAFWKPELRALLGLVLESRGDAGGAREAYRKALAHARGARDPALALLVEGRLAALGPGAAGSPY